MVGLDVEAGSIAASEVQRNGHVQVTKSGTLPLGSGIFREGEVADPDALGEALKEMFAQHGLSKNVRLGIANQRVAVRSLRLPSIEDKQELETAIRFQAQDHIPMPLEQAVMDWQVVGRGTAEDGSERVDVVAVAARRDMLGSLMEAMGKAGLKPTGIDLSAFGMVRALAREAYPGSVPATSSAPRTPAAAPTRSGSQPAQRGGDEPTQPIAEPAKLYCNLGDVTNLAVARGSTCLFTRVSSFGVEGIAQKLAERRQLTLEHARQWLVHVGLERPAETVDGDPETVAATREALVEGAAKLVDELRLSLEFYAAQEGATPLTASSSAGPGRRSPASPSASSATSASASRSAARARSRISATPRPPASPSPTASHWRAERCAPSTSYRLSSAAASGRRPAAARRLWRRRASSPSRWSAITAIVLTNNTVSDRKAEVAVLEQQEAEATELADSLSSYAEFASLEQKRVATVPPWPRAASTGSGCCASLPSSSPMASG